MSAYPFVPAYVQLGVRKGPVMAFVVHMAEGGGTVSFLSKPNPRDVSVHYVIEYTGRIVQMVLESEATGSINPNDLRTTDDPLIFGATVRQAVMGAWDNDPNSAVITVELEGFAAAGPNAAQHGSLRTLVDDVRTRFPRMGLLGHRDFQDYKPCPGKLIHWPDLGGHGVATTEELVKTVLTIPPTTAILPNTGVPVLDQPAGTLIYTTKVGDKFPLLGQAGTSYHALRMPGNVLGYLAHGSVASTEPIPAPAPPDCTDAVAAEHERTRAAAIAAVEAI